MTISLVMTSCNRQQELDRFAFALSRQNFSEEVEVIFVAQGSAQFRLPESSTMKIRIIERRVEGRVSLAKARNIGIQEASGEIMGFPDDDCWYEQDLLARIGAYFEEYRNIDCICTNVCDPVSKRSLGAYRPRGVTREVSYWNVSCLGNSNGIFLRANALKRIGKPFDESLGVGTEIGSGEEVEFLGRILDAGFTVNYVGKLEVFHDVRTESIEKIYSYAIGFGYVNWSFIKKRHVGALAYLVEIVARSCAGIARYLLVREKRGLYLARLKGIFRGCVASGRAIDC